MSRSREGLARALLDRIKAGAVEAADRAGYEVRRKDLLLADEGFDRLYARCREYTLTSRARMYACRQAATYAVAAQIPGDVVECGVWRGGSSMMLAGSLLDAGERSRRVWLYDTFAGMTEPEAVDRTFDGAPTLPDWEASRQSDGTIDWVRAPLDEVRANMASTGYPAELVNFVEGKVEETIPATIPEQIAVLRLDTDWYASTKHELEHLFPLLARGGVLLIDDYGNYEGAKLAVDEYFESTGSPLLLARTDDTGRLAINWR